MKTRVPGYARRFVLRHGDHCIHMASEATPRLVTEGHPMLCRLAASPCQCRSKTQLLTNVSYTTEQLFSLDQAGLGGQCIVPSTVNLGLTIHTGGTCQLTNEAMVKIPLQLSLTTLLSKQLVKFQTRLAAANRANLSIHVKIIYFNTFSLSLFYNSQTQRFFRPSFSSRCTTQWQTFCYSDIGSRNTYWLGSAGGCAKAHCLTQPSCRQFPSLDASYGKDIGPLQKNKKVHMPYKSNNVGSIGNSSFLLKTHSAPSPLKTKQYPGAEGEWIQTALQTTHHWQIACSLS